MKNFISAKKIILYSTKMNFTDKINNKFTNLHLNKRSKRQKIIVQKMSKFKVNNFVWVKDFCINLFLNKIFYYLHQVLMQTDANIV